MKINIKQNTSIKFEIEFESLDEFFEELLVQFDPDKTSKVRECLFAYLYNHEQNYIEQYDEFKQKLSEKNTGKQIDVVGAIK